MKQATGKQKAARSAALAPKHEMRAGAQGVALAPPVYGVAVDSQPVAATPPGTLVQAKLTIGAPGDKYEREADRVAEQVVQQLHAPASPAIQLQAAPAAEKRQMKSLLQLKGSEGSIAAPPVVESSIQQSRGQGQPLTEQIRQPMERVFGADFSGVRVHTDAQADQLNQSLQAQAFTTGQDLFFRQGAYDVRSPEGQGLLAHELTHVVQQTNHRTSGETIAQMSPQAATIGNRQGAGLHKSNRKQVASKTAARISVRSGGILGSGIKSKIPFNANITVDFAKTAEGGTYVWAQYNSEEGYIKAGNVAETNIKWRNHHQQNIISETTGFLAGIGASPTAGFTLPQGSLTVANVPALNNFHVQPITSMTAPENLTRLQKGFLSGGLTNL